MISVCLDDVCALSCVFVKFVWCFLCDSVKCVYSGECVSVVSGVFLRYVQYGFCVQCVECMLCLCVTCVHCEECVWSLACAFVR